MDTFTKSYIGTALWSSTDSSDHPLDCNYDTDDISPECMKQMIEDCRAFQETAGDMIAGREERAGHDFWLTRNGHGAGFWDGDWIQHGDKLTGISKTYGSVDLYVGDDGKIYC
jgi:hypothetical protein